MECTLQWTLDGLMDWILEWTLECALGLDSGVDSGVDSGEDSEVVWCGTSVRTVGGLIRLCIGFGSVGNLLRPGLERWGP